VDELEAALHEAWKRASAQHPEVVLGWDDYRGHALALRTDAKVHLDDLFLACACAKGDAAALRHFEREVLTAADAAVRGLDGSPGFVDEVRQRVRAKLLVGSPDQPPRIAEYAGRGALIAWVTVSAVRTGLSLLRETKRAEKYAGDGWAEALALPDTGDVEIDYIKDRYREQFKRGLVDACSKLPARDRTILRLHFVDGLNIDQIGVIYGVHRATVARWIAKSRAALLTSTRQFLTEHLAVPPSEISSLDRLVRSQLDVSLGELFGSDEDLGEDGSDEDGAAPG
jgi:RNA polymerase sigma-70 factor (ECF subfamily)